MSPQNPYSNWMSTDHVPHLGMPPSQRLDTYLQMCFPFSTLSALDVAGCESLLNSYLAPKATKVAIVTISISKFFFFFLVSKEVYSWGCGEYGKMWPWPSLMVHGRANMFVQTNKILISLITTQAGVRFSRIWLLFSSLQHVILNIVWICFCLSVNISMSLSAPLSTSCARRLKRHNRMTQKPTVFNFSGDSSDFTIHKPTQTSL